MVAATIPSGSGKKENEKRGKRKRKTKAPRDVKNYGDRVQPLTSAYESENTGCEVVFISNTKATVCYGCKGRVQDSPGDPPPPAPHDIFLRHKEHRVFRHHGETRISKTPEPPAHLCLVRFRSHQIGRRCSSKNNRTPISSCCGVNLEFGFKLKQVKVKTHFMVYTRLCVLQRHSNVQNNAEWLERRTFFLNC